MLFRSHIITVETTRDVTDPELTERYIRVEKDPYSGFYALVGSGTTHKYLLYRRRSLVGCRLWGHTDSDTTEAT